MVAPVRVAIGANSSRTNSIRSSMGKNRSLPVIGRNTDHQMVKDFSRHG